MNSSAHMNARAAELTSDRSDFRMSARGLSKSFGPVSALKGVTLDLRPGEIHALCGENGAGKSTFIKLLTGVLQPDEGTIMVESQQLTLTSPRDAQLAGIALVAQELSVCPDLSVVDNIWLGAVTVPFLHRRAALRRRAREVLELVGMEHITLDTLVSQLSIGERQLIEIARMLTRDARILLLDEPTATLSDREIEKLSTALLALKREGRSIIYITHRLGEVFDICDTVTVFRNGELVDTKGVAEVNRDSLLEMMLGRAPGKLYPASRPASRSIRLDIDRLSVPGAVDDFSLRIPRGSVVCLAGQLGSGADIVIRAVAGLVHTARGRVSVDGATLALGSSVRALRRNVMYVSGDRAADGIFCDLSIFDNLVATRLHRHTRFGLLDWRSLWVKAAGVADQVRADKRRLRSNARELSGGNQQKLAFGRCIDRGAAGVLVMNEPTRGIDMGARADIYRLIRTFCDNGHAVLVASTDLEEVLGLGDFVVTMYRGRLVGHYRRGEASMQRIVADITHPAP